MTFARPPQANERSQRPVWADDEWLKQYGSGTGRTENPKLPAANGKDTNDSGWYLLRERIYCLNVVEGENATADATAQKAQQSSSLPRVYLDIKMGLLLFRAFQKTVLLSLQVFVILDGL